MAIGQIGGYRVDGMLSGGDMAQVYLGYDERLDRNVALKLICLPESRKRREHILQEARCLAAIDSSRIIKVYDILYCRNYIIFVLQYVPGCNLTQLMCCYPISLPMAVSIAVDLCSALTHINTLRIVHRDLKPDNVFISTQGRAVLGDFGIAINTEASGTTYSGSRVCVAPEQYLGEAVTHQTDLFALGVVLYHLVWGCHPFVSDGYLDEKRLLAGVYTPFTETPNRKHRVPAILRDLLVALLQLTPDKRPESANAVARQLHRVCRSKLLSAKVQLASEAKRAASLMPAPEKMPLPFDLMLQHGSHLAKHTGVCQ